MKTFLFCLCCMIFLQNTAVVEGRTLRAVTTTEDLAAITKAIGGGRVQVDSMAKGMQDPHFIDAKPSYILKLAQADLFVQVGLGLEAGWVPSLLTGARNPKIQPGGIGYVDASQEIAVLHIPSGKVDRSAGDVHAEGNPHYWLDPMNGKQIAENIAAGLIRIDPEGKTIYEAGLKEFSDKLDAEIKKWTEAMLPFKGTNVVAYHNSWPYFIKRFDLNVVDYVEPKPGIPPSTAHVDQLIRRIQKEGVKIILVEPYFDGRTPQFIAKSSGARVVPLPPSVSTGTDIKDYFQLFDHLIQTLSDALKREEM